MFNHHDCHGRQNDFNQIFAGDNEINMEIDVNMGSNAAATQSWPMAGGMGMPVAQGGVSQPIIEPTQERVVNRTIVHEVPHVCPQRTRIINNHVFKHTFRPSHTCCEENVCTNVQCGSCCQFR